MKAIILAAGMSNRLQSINDGLPKACIEINQDETILDRNLKILLEQGIKDVTIVLGYSYERARNLILKKWQDSDLKLSFINNQDYEKKDNIYSVYLIRDLLDDETLLFNSDLVFKAEILSQTLEFARSRQDSFLVVDDHKQLVSEDMKVLVDEAGVVKRVSKSLDNSSSHGEYIGLLRINSADAKTYAAKLAELVENDDVKRHYEYALDQILTSINVKSLSTNKLAWKEIDTPADLAEAQSLLYHECSNTH
jgi:phosphoenolpyruvate phosphomutase